MGAGILQGGNTTARIQTIQADVTVPTVTRPFRPSPGSNVPEIRSPIPAAAIGEAGEQLGRILEVQGRHQQILDSDAAEDNFKAQYRTNSAQNRTNLPGSQWANAIKQQMSDATQKMMDDPANAHIAPFIKARFPALTNLMQSEELQAGTLETAKSQHDQYEVGQTQRAAQAGADFMVKSDGTFADGPVAQSLRAKETSLQNGLWANNPDARALLQQQFEQKVVQQRGQAIAQTRPELLTPFLKANLDKFTPAEQKSLNDSAISAQELPYHQVKANHEQAAAQAINNLDQLAAKHDPTLAAAARNANVAGYIDDKQFENYTHTKWRDPFATSTPGLVDSYLKDINQNPMRYSAADIAAIPADQLNPDDRHKIQAARADSEAFAKKAIGGEYLRSLDTVRSALTPRIVVNREAVTERVNAALSSMKAAKEEGQFQTVKDVQDFTKNVLATYQVGKPKTTPTHVVGPAPRFAPIPPSIAAKIRAEAASSGWEPSD